MLNPSNILGEWQIREESNSQFENQCINNNEDNLKEIQFFQIDEDNKRLQILHHNINCSKMFIYATNEEDYVKYSKYFYYEAKILIKLKEKEYYLSQKLATRETAIFKGIKRIGDKQYEFVFKIYFRDDLQDFDQEIKIMKQFEKNINVIKMFDVIVSKGFQIIVLEKCKISLYNQLMNSETFSEDTIRRIIFDLLDGLIQLRIYNCIHLDIKPSNILLSNSGEYVYTDFKYSSVKLNNDPVEAKGYTKGFSPLEQQKNEKTIDFKTDIYALGVTILKIMEVYQKKKQDSFSEKIVRIVKDHMMQERQQNRNDCLELYKKFFDILLKDQKNNKLFRYLQKMKRIENLNSFDPNKDNDYFAIARNQYLLRQLDIYNKYNFIKKKQALILQQIGLNYFSIGDIKNSLKYFLQSLEYRTQQLKEDYFDMIISFICIGTCYYFLGDSKISELYLLQSFALIENISNLEKKFNSFYLVGCFYQCIGMNSQALKYFFQSYQIALLIFKSNHVEIIGILYNIGCCYANLNDKSSALFYEQKSIKIIKSLSSQQKSSQLKNQELHKLKYLFILRNFQLCSQYKNISELLQGLLIFSEDTAGIRNKLPKENSFFIVKHLLIHGDNQFSRQFATFHKQHLKNEEQMKIQCLKQQPIKYLESYLCQIKKKSSSGKIRKKEMKGLVDEFNKMFQTTEIYHNKVEEESSFLKEFSCMSSTKIQAFARSCKVMEKLQNKPRLIQIISCLYFLFKPYQGRILQINPGEGKSTMIALLTATYALLGKSVLIVVSNSAQAKKKCEKYQEFYQILNLKAVYLTDDIENKKKQKIYENYKIIYGEVFQFIQQFQNQIYKKEGETMFDYCIVDELDQMLFHKSYLSQFKIRQIENLDKLEIFFILIWQTICTNINKLSEDHKHFYFENGNGEQVVIDARQFVKDDVSKILFENIDFNESKLENIPPQLIKFAQSQLEEWVEKAFQALILQKNIHYKVENDDIIKMDNQHDINDCKNQIWGQGLYQFLQLKEKLNISPLDISLDSISNIYFFQNIRTNLIGFTEAFGSDQFAESLEISYHLNLFQIPPFLPSKLKILEPIVYQQKEEYESALVEQMQGLQQKERPCLLIFQNIVKAQYFAQLFSSFFSKQYIKEYYNTEFSIKDQLDSFLIILITYSTKTHFKIGQQTEQKGGLHVIVTFLPKDERADLKAYGRAGRYGQNGSAQMLICSEIDELIKKKNIKKDNNLLEQRDTLNYQKYKDKKSKLFYLYRNDTFYNIIMGDIIDSCSYDDNVEQIAKYFEDRWALFLTTIKSSLEHSDFYIFREDIINILKSKDFNGNKSVFQK